MDPPEGIDAGGGFAHGILKGGGNSAMRGPDKVVLTLPQDRSRVPAANVRIAWFKTAPLVDRYWYETASESHFTFEVVDSLVTDTSHVFPVLTAGTYWWKRPSLVRKAA